MGDHGTVLVFDEQDTKTKLIIVAEDLFGQRGIEAVSLREIASEAQQGNTNAVKYHFKSKAGLVNSIMNYRIHQMETPRDHLLRFAQKKGLTSDARALLEALCLPQLDIVNKAGRHSYAAFMMQFYQWQDNERNRFDNVKRWPALSEIFDLLVQRISYVPREVARARIRQCNRMFQDFLLCFDPGAQHETNLKPGVLLDDTFEIMSAALCAPYHAGRAGRGYASESHIKKNLKRS